MQNRAAWSARWAHNPEVTGSNPVFAIFVMFNITNRLFYCRMTLLFLVLLSTMIHLLTLVQIYNVTTAPLFTTSMFFNILLGFLALGLLLGDGIYLINAIFEHFEFILTEEISNILARILLFTILGTTVISFISLIVGPGRLYKK